MAIRYLLALTILAYIASACTDGDRSSPTCSALQSRAQDYVPEKKDKPNEVEDVNDADLIMHMQMRVAVDAPPVAGNPQEKQPHAEVAKLAQDLVAPQEQKPSEKHGMGSASTASVVKQNVVQPLEDDAVLPWMQDYARSLPFFQIATVFGILTICFILRKLVHVTEQKVMKERAAQLDVFDASAKLQQMLQALRFEPRGEDEVQPLSREMQSPVAVECGSGSNVEEMEEEEAEEEPEAEAAVESAVIAFAERAKQRARDMCQKLADEGQKLASEGQKLANELANEAYPQQKNPESKGKEMRLKVQVIAC